MLALISDRIFFETAFVICNGICDAFFTHCHCEPSEAISSCYFSNGLFKFVTINT